MSHLLKRLSFSKLEFSFAVDDSVCEMVLPTWRIPPLAIRALQSERPEDAAIIIGRVGSG
jgi:hypothetical protein